jgi:hypothetical protein
VSDRALRAVERHARGSEAHAAALARAGRWAEAADAYRLLVAAADKSREAALHSLRDAEFTQDLWAGAGPLARAQAPAPIPTMGDVRALRASHRAACAELRRLRAATVVAALAEFDNRRKS